MQQCLNDCRIQTDISESSLRFTVGCQDVITSQLYLIIIAGALFDYLFIFDIIVEEY